MESTFAIINKNQPIIIDTIEGQNKAQVEGNEVELVEPEEELLPEEETMEFIPNRKMTNLCSLFMLIGFCVSVAVMYVYCVCLGNKYRVISGYDTCTRICGQKNIIEDAHKIGGHCKNGQMTDLPFLNTSTECMATCNPETNFIYRRLFFKRCLPKNINVNPYKEKTDKTRKFMEEVFEDLDAAYMTLFIISMVSFAISYFLVVLFRFFGKYTAYITIILHLGISVATTVCAWLLFGSYSSTTYQAKVSLTAAILVTLIIPLSIVFLVFKGNRMRAVSKLFRETSNSLADMPWMFGQPVACVFFMMLFVAGWIYLALIIESSGRRDDDAKPVIFRKDIVSKISRYYNLISISWMPHFVVTCEQMVTGRAIQTWYYNRNRAINGYPVFEAILTFSFNHFGSVARSSFITATVIGPFLQNFMGLFGWLLAKVSKKLGCKCSLKCKNPCCCKKRRLTKEPTIKKRRCCKRCYKKESCCFCCRIFCILCGQGCRWQMLWCVTVHSGSLRYTAKNGSMLVAMRGYTLGEAGDESRRLLANFEKLDLVVEGLMIFAKLFMVQLTCLIGYAMLEPLKLQHIWVSLGIVLVSSAMITHAVFNLYESAAVAIYLCFAEDYRDNDGDLEPYSMSPLMKSLIEECKKKKRRDFIVPKQDLKEA